MNGPYRDDDAARRQVLVGQVADLHGQVVDLECRIAHERYRFRLVKSWLIAAVIALLCSSVDGVVRSYRHGRELAECQQRVERAP